MAAVAGDAVTGGACVDATAGEPQPATPHERDEDGQDGQDGRGATAPNRRCGLEEGHPTSEASAVLPARMRFPIRRRYGDLSSIGVMRVLVVEDEPLLAGAIRDGLRLEAIAADTAGDGDTALELLSINSYDIAVLDRDVPGPSGDEIARQIVASGSGMPILMLTAADRLDDKVSGFELGADDYLTKPFDLQELVLRIRALDRRRAHARPPVRELAGLRVDPFRREVYRDGRYVALTRKQFAVLDVLVAADGGVVSAEELLERAWDENADPFTNAVRITVSALRKRLGEPWVIATVPGVGYRIATAPGTAGAGRRAMARAWGPSARLKLTLSYAGFLMVAGTCCWRPCGCSSCATCPTSAGFGPGPASPTRSDLLDAFAPAGGPGAGRPAGRRPGRRLVPRRPDARPPDQDHRGHPDRRHRVALATGSGSRAAPTSSASSPTGSTPCSRGSRRRSPSSSGSPPTPRTSCAPRSRSPRPCSTWPARTPTATTRGSSTSSMPSTPGRSASPRPCCC